MYWWTDVPGVLGVPVVISNYLDQNQIMSKFKIHNMGIKGHGGVEIFIPSRYNVG